MSTHEFESPERPQEAQYREPEPEAPAGPEVTDGPAEAWTPRSGRPPLSGAARGVRRRRGRRLAPPEEVIAPRRTVTAEQRILLLDAWQRSGLAATDFAALVGMSKHTLYLWRQRFSALGPEGLLDHARGPAAGSKLPEATKRAILMLKEGHPDYGCERISLLLARGPGLGASEGAVARVLKEAGYATVEEGTRAHGEEPHRFERARPNQLWQTDLFTFVLPRQNRRVYLMAFLDDHSRFIVGYGLYASCVTALVLETLRAAVVAYGRPEEVLTDNGPQYQTWRGKSAFTKELEKQGIRQLVARPKRPQTLGKIERFWGSLWRECVEGALFVDLADARLRVGHFIDHYNFQRPHQGIDGLVPADRYFEAAPEVRQTLAARVATNALELAQGGQVKRGFYLTGQVGGEAVSVHAEGERVVVRRGDGAAVTLVGAEVAPAAAPPPGPELPVPVTPGALLAETGAVAEAPDEDRAPGTSPFDDPFAALAETEVGDE
jgi:transposase InsO family protein